MREVMIFDWDQAARLIVARQAQNAEAGLEDDWYYTGGVILRDGEPVSGFPWLASAWERPQLIIDGGEPIDCYRLQSEAADWGARTYWPESALEILRGRPGGPTVPRLSRGGTL